MPTDDLEARARALAVQILETPMLGTAEHARQSLTTAILTLCRQVAGEAARGMRDAAAGECEGLAKRAAHAATGRRAMGHYDGETSTLVHQVETADALARRIRSLPLPSATAEATPYCAHGREVACSICDAPSTGEAGPVEAPTILPAVMHCPFCGARHVDEGEWETRPHHKHLCLSCNRLWRVEPYCRGIPETTPAAPRVSRELTCAACGAFQGMHWPACPAAPHVDARCSTGWCGTTVAGGPLEGMPVFCPEHLPPAAPRVEGVGAMEPEQVRNALLRGLTERPAVFQCSDHHCACGACRLGNDGKYRKPVAVAKGLRDGLALAETIVLAQAEHVREAHAENYGPDVDAEEALRDAASRIRSLIQSDDPPVVRQDGGPGCGVLVFGDLRCGRGANGGIILCPDCMGKPGPNSATIGQQPAVGQGGEPRTCDTCLGRRKVWRWGEKVTCDGGCEGTGVLPPQQPHPSTGCGAKLKLGGFRCGDIAGNPGPMLLCDKCREHSAGKDTKKRKPDTLDNVAILAEWDRRTDGAHAGQVFYTPIPSEEEGGPNCWCAMKPHRPHTHGGPGTEKK